MPVMLNIIIYFFGENVAFKCKYEVAINDVIFKQTENTQDTFYVLNLLIHPFPGKSFYLDKKFNNWCYVLYFTSALLFPFPA